MTKIELLNISNFYSSYYLLALSEVGNLEYNPTEEFEKFNNRGFVIFRIGGKIGVIDNHDPVGVDAELYGKSDFYFATNKLKDNPSYNQQKVKPIFPHYPINILGLYFRLYGISLVFKLKPRDLARELYVLNSRPSYKSLDESNYQHHNYVFFSGSTWKKESWANEIRARFIRACKANPKIEFEGGFIPRSDGNNFGYDEELNTKKYGPKEFSHLSSKSLISLNNPAVLGAVSWRLAEYWNSSSFVLSFPFQIDLPEFPKHDSEIHYLNDADEYESIIQKAVDDKEFHAKIAKGGKKYFEKNCTPIAQGNYLLSFFK